MHKASLYKPVGDKKAVKCMACRQYCMVQQGNFGKCKTRYNKTGELFSLVYGKTTGLQLDPIEKKPLFHFLPGSEILSFGTLGCNFKCEFCQNWITSQQIVDNQGRTKENLLNVEALINKFSENISPEEIIDSCLKVKAEAIAYTYNEPSIFFEYTYDTSKLAHKNGIKNVYVTNGYSSREALNEISKYLDAANIDIKSFNKKFYKDVCGGNLDAVLESIAYFVEKGIWVELTTLLIPGKNDSISEIKDIAKFISTLSTDIPWHISRFTPQYKMSNIPKTDLESIKKAYDIGKSEGLKYVYCGNVLDDKTQSTYCPNCNELVIWRDWGQIEIRCFRNGKCGKCGAMIPGIWR